MANPLRINIDDTSPSIIYYPFADTFGTPDLLSGWNPYYTSSGYAAFQGQIGNGTSLHRTSLDGASLSIRWNGRCQGVSGLIDLINVILNTTTGTGIQLLGNVSQASYSLTLEGTPTLANSSSPSDGILADFFGLNDGSHIVTLTVHTASSPSPDMFVAFDQALITSSPALDETKYIFGLASL
jgi:hypothetical protein